MMQQHHPQVQHHPQLRPFAPASPSVHHQLGGGDLSHRSSLSGSSNGSMGELGSGGEAAAVAAAAAAAAAAVEALPAAEVEQRKVVVLGVPWQTDDATLERHFSRFGGVEGAQIMRERHTGKSRGFGFVTFQTPGEARLAVASEHLIDGRKCEAKIALPEGKVGSAKTTRIFVARIPSSVTDAQFRLYFEQFGPCQDCYMPKDPSKQGHRGIGFVTYASPESVEVVMSRTHVLNGNEIAIDRATPKERGAASASTSVLPGRLSMSQPNLQLMGGSGHGGGQFAFMQQQQQQRQQQHQQHMQPSSPPRWSESVLGMGGMGSRRMSHPALPISSALGSPPQPVQQQQLGSGGGSAADFGSAGGYHALAGSLGGYGSGVNLQLLAQAQVAVMQQQLGGGGLPGGLEGSSPSQLINLLSANSAAAAAGGSTHGGGSLHGGGGGSLHGGSLHGGMQYSGSLPGSLRANNSMSQLPSSTASSHNDLAGLLAAQHQQQEQLSRLGGMPMRTGSGVGVHGMTAAAARSAGPRIFVGKLSRDTTEQDVKDHFMRFGFVMDVYLPRDKANKQDHRGFGFVTFETDAAIKRVVAHGPHQIRGSIVAIDAAVPRQEEVLVSLNGPLGSAGHSVGGGLARGALLEEPSEAEQALQAMGLLSLEGSGHGRALLGAAQQPY